MKGVRIIIAALGALLLGACSRETDRAYWVKTMDRIVAPVFENLAEGTLRKNMPVETVDGLNTGNERKDVTHLEALGRAFSGIAPWLELGPDDSPEGQLRARYIDLVVRGIAQAVDPESLDYLPFDGPGRQPLVDAAFFAQGLLRAEKAIWPRLDTLTRSRVIREMQASRRITPGNSNWLLFSAIIEAALLEFSGAYDPAPVDRAFSSMDQWYKGDGWYGDGPQFHLDYYNSYVIHPMLLEVAAVMKRHGMPWGDYYEKEVPRFTRFAEQQEKLISPDGTYPVLGRSMDYRFGCFQVLSEAALLGLLPKTLTPGGVRSALTAVLKRQLVPESFDKEGWLTLGFCGHQPGVAEKYISTGSAYLCTFIFLPLGLPAEDDFWTAAPESWSSCRAWGGEPIQADHAIKN